MKTLFASVAVALLLAGPAMARNGDASHSHSNSSSVSNSNSSSKATNRNVNNNVEKRQPGAIGLPGLTSAGSCPIGSFSVGGGFPGGSIGLGFTKGDKDCRNAYWADWMAKNGYKRQAIQLMVNEIPEVRRAFGFK